MELPRTNDPAADWPVGDWTRTNDHTETKTEYLARTASLSSEANDLSISVTVYLPSGRTISVDYTFPSSSLGEVDREQVIEHLDSVVSAARAAVFTARL